VKEDEKPAKDGPWRHVARGIFPDVCRLSIRKADSGNLAVIAVDKNSTIENLLME
jgi:hypothetical protein